MDPLLKSDKQYKFRDCGLTFRATARHWGEVMGSIPGKNYFIAEVVKSMNYYCYVKCTT